MNGEKLCQAHRLVNLADKLRLINIDHTKHYSDWEFRKDSLGMRGRSNAALTKRQRVSPSSEKYSSMETAVAYRQFSFHFVATGAASEEPTTQARHVGGDYLRLWQTTHTELLLANDSERWFSEC